jgi:D-alanyl-D-alanine carboxypeptidase (penicillin-binding protein 5/6)
MSETITADSWAIYQLTDFCPIRGKNAVKKRQIASLTKMFTLAAALRIEKRLRLNPSTMVRITDSFEIGTTSNLERGYWMTINDLYYGMMLPSGNDASLVIAQYFGYFLQVESRCEAYELRKSKSLRWI